MSAAPSFSPGVALAQAEVEVRTPDNPSDPAGPWRAIDTRGGGVRRQRGGPPGYFAAAPPDTAAVWLGKAGFGDRPGRGVLGDQAVGGLKLRHWLNEMRAVAPPEAEPDERLVTAAPAVFGLVRLLRRWLPEAAVSSGRLMHNIEALETWTENQKPPPEGMAADGQYSPWLANGDGGEGDRALLHCRPYLRRDVLLAQLLAGPWPGSNWRRIGPADAELARNNEGPLWPGLVEARPPSRIALLNGTERTLWSLDEIRAWPGGRHDDWSILGGWQADPGPPPLAFAAPPTAAVSAFVAWHLLWEAPPWKSPLRIWLSSQARAQVAPGAQACARWIDANGVGRMLGLHAGAFYVSLPAELTPELASTLLPANTLIPAGAMAAAERQLPEAEARGQRVRQRLKQALDAKPPTPLPPPAWPDLLLSGSAPQIARADGRLKLMPPAFASQLETPEAPDTPSAAKPPEAPEAPPAGAAPEPSGPGSPSTRKAA